MIVNSKRQILEMNAYLGRMQKHVENVVLDIQGQFEVLQDQERQLESEAYGKTVDAEHIVNHIRVGVIKLRDVSEKIRATIDEYQVTIRESRFNVAEIASMKQQLLPRWQYFHRGIQYMRNYEEKASAKVDSSSGSRSALYNRLFFALSTDG